METKDMLYLVSEYARQGEIFGKSSQYVALPFRVFFDYGFLARLYDGSRP